MWDHLCCTLGREEHLYRRELVQVRTNDVFRVQTVLFCLQQMRSATTYLEWEKAARKLDKHDGKTHLPFLSIRHTSLGLHAWKDVRECSLYDYKRIELNIQILKQLVRCRCDGLSALLASAA